jgi:hypothetical protein
MVTGFFMVASSVMFGCGAMVFGSLFVMLGGLGMMFRGVF